MALPKVTKGYDANGNAIGGTALQESYDANNAARTITRGSTATFYYGATGARYRETAPSGTTIFGSDGYERTGTGTTATHRQELGPVVFTVTNSKTTATYMLRDRLGSVLTETNDSGVVLTANGSPAQRSYDAFGKVRNGDFGDSTYGILNLRPITLRGFTGQEHQDDVQVIHMNGRIYDYQLGRFLGVDPIIGNPLSSQSMNPYSYIGNNPLSGKDPTGYACTDAAGGGGGNSNSCGRMEEHDQHEGFKVAYQAPSGNGAKGQSASSSTAIDSAKIGTANDPGTQHNGNPASGGGYNGGGCQVPMKCNQDDSDDTLRESQNGPISKPFNAPNSAVPPPDKSELDFVQSISGKFQNKNIEYCALGCKDSQDSFSL